MNCKCLEEFWEIAKDFPGHIDPDMDKFCNDGNCIKDEN